MTTTPKYTPGPWRHVAAFKIQTAPKKSFVILGDGYEGASGEELSANAALIASAPDLAARCQKLEAEKAELRVALSSCLGNATAILANFMDIDGLPVGHIGSIETAAEEALARTTPSPLYEAAPRMLAELRAIGHQTTITTQHFNRLQFLIEKIEATGKEG